MKIILKILIILILIFPICEKKIYANEKIKIGLLIPLSGKNAELGKSIIQSVRLAINQINNDLIEIYPKDTKSDPNNTLRAAYELKEKGIKIIIGPIFNENLIYLDELEDITFLSFTNKIIKNPKNIISVGINAQSQLNAIIKFQEKRKLNKTILLLPNSDYSNEVKKAILKTKIKIKKIYTYDSNPTKLTKQIEKITKYKERKLDLENEIKKIEKSDNINKEKKIKKLKKKYTLGFVNFDSVIMVDFDESLKSLTTSLLYTDISPKKISFITFNQWFDKSLLKEKSSQPLYFPSIDEENFHKFSEKYFSEFKDYPNELSIVAYDLIGFIYYLIYKNNFVIDKKLFFKKNKFKGKIGIFEIEKNQINHILSFYKIEDEKFKKIF